MPRLPSAAAIRSKDLLNCGLTPTAPALLRFSRLKSRWVIYVVGTHHTGTFLMACRNHGSGPLLRGPLGFGRWTVTAYSCETRTMRWPTTGQGYPHWTARLTSIPSGA